MPGTPGTHLFEYALIRVVPRVEREEFLNVGVVLYCAAQRYLELRYVLDKQRLALLCADTDMAALEAQLRAFEQLCAGTKAAGPLGQLAAKERFRWLTATRSTILQTSRAHPGFCEDAAARLDTLFAQLVL